MIMMKHFFCSIRPSPGLLPVLGPLEQYLTPTIDVALLISSRVGADFNVGAVFIMLFVLAYS